MREKGTRRQRGPTRLLAAVCQVRPVAPEPVKNQKCAVRAKAIQCPPPKPTVLAAGTPRFPSSTPALGFPGRCAPQSCGTCSAPSQKRPASRRPGLALPTFRRSGAEHREQFSLRNIQPRSTAVSVWSRKHLSGWRKSPRTLPSRRPGVARAGETEGPAGCVSLQADPEAGGGLYPPPALPPSLALP